MTRSIMGHFRKDRNLYIGFSPERVDPGRTDPPADKIPKIISGLDHESLEKIKELYESVFEKVVPVSSMETAEMCKLFENCFRMVNIAYVNEIADNCQSHGIDVYEMVRACSTKPFGFMPFFPGLGVGGHCIPVNPFYLFTNNTLPLLKTATDVSLKRPETKAYEVMETADNILVVGLAFKPGETYTMNSPGLDMTNVLVKNEKNVTVYDPLVDPNTNVVKHLKFLDTENWNSEFISNNYDAVVVAIKQKNIDFTVLGNVTCKVFNFCEL
jgi:nucleotide sugar dehydrogenase